MESLNIDDFARKLIADKCSALIESERMLPDNILTIVKNVRDEYFKNPTPKNYENIKNLFSQTKYVDDSIDYKDFNRRILLIAFKFAINKSKDHFKNYIHVLDVAIKRLDKINPDLKSSPRAMLQHYNECLENLDNPRNDEHHLLTFGKEIATKIFIETIDLYSCSNKSSIELSSANVVSSFIKSKEEKSTMLASAINSKKRQIKTSTFKIPTALFQL